MNNLNDELNNLTEVSKKMNEVVDKFFESITDNPEIEIPILLDSDQWFGCVCALDLTRKMIENIVEGIDNDIGDLRDIVQEMTVVGINNPVNFISNESRGIIGEIEKIRLWITEVLITGRKNISESPRNINPTELYILMKRTDFDEAEICFSVDESMLLAHCLDFISEIEKNYLGKIDNHIIEAFGFGLSTEQISAFGDLGEVVDGLITQNLFKLFNEYFKKNVEIKLG